jgi:hypothetical protein
MIGFYIINICFFLASHKEEEEDEEEKEISKKRRKLQTNNTTGYRGVYVSGVGFRAQIVVKGKTQYIGTYDTAKQAGLAWVRNVSSIFDYFFFSF